VQVSLQFADILRSLMETRRLSPDAICRASGRAQSTINGLLTGRTPPRAEILQDIAPVLEMLLADLLVIAGVSKEPDPSPRRPYRASPQIGQLVAAASFLTAEQIAGLADLAANLKAQRI
jgi:transcriptional regulator with XRE-family HTH domain